MLAVVIIKDLSSSKSTYICPPGRNNGYIYKYRICFLIHLFYERYKFLRKQTFGKGGKTRYSKTLRIVWLLMTALRINGSHTPEALLAGGTG